MYSKKIAFSLFTVPALCTLILFLICLLVITHQGYEYQLRRQLDKQHEQARREQLLSEKNIQDITPKNKDSFLWSKVKNVDEFENEYSFKKVRLTGIFDHNKEILVEKYKNGEKGVEVVTPFYTHLDKEGEPCGILVNRGWLPWDFKDFKKHHATQMSGEIVGLLYKGDPVTKYGLTNEPTLQRYTIVKPSDFALITQLKNRDEASQFMLLKIDEDLNARQIYPSSPSIEEFSQWRITPERHAAYATLWKYLTFGGVFANTLVWLYF